VILVQPPNLTKVRDISGINLTKERRVWTGLKGFFAFMTGG
jgi:hypothetical protein